MDFYFLQQIRVAQERFTNLDKRLKSTQDDNDRLRSERDMLRERVVELQASLRDRETEVRTLPGIKEQE